MHPTNNTYEVVLDGKVMARGGHTDVTIAFNIACDAASMYVLNGPLELRFCPSQATLESARGH